MHVLFVDHTSLVSGAQRALLDLVGALPDEVSATVMCPPGQLADLVRDLGVDVIEFGGTSGSLRLHPLRTPKAAAEIALSARALARAAAATNADVIHANSIRAALIAALARRVTGVPTVAHVHDALPATTSADVVRRVVGRSADAIITISEYTTRNFVTRPPRGRVHMLYNPLDLERFDPAAMTRAEARAALGLDPRTPLVGLLAQITPWKGQETAIRAHALLRSTVPDAKLLLVGEPKFVGKATRYDNRAYERSLQALVDELGLREHVEFWGERQDVPVIVRALDVAVAPSWEEPFGRSVIEAMALETAVVATNVGGPAEYVGDGVDGLLAPPRDPQAWAAAVAGLLRDGERRAAIATRGSKKVRRLFDRSVYAQNVVAVYEDVVAAAPPQRLRVLYVDHQSVIGGGQRSMIELIRAMAREHDVTLACPDGPLADAVRADGVAVLPIPPSQLTFRLSPRDTPRELLRALVGQRVLRRAVAGFGPDVVHANSLRAGLLAMALPRRVPLVVHCRDILPSGPAAAAVKAVLLRRSHRLVAVSREVARRFAGTQWARRRVTVVDNPVDPRRFDPARFDRANARRELGIDGGPVIGVLAQITPWKGQTRAVRILHELRRTQPRAQLVLAGEAKFVTTATRFDNRAYERELRELVEALDVRSVVHFVGDRDDPERIYAALDVVLVPSTEEPFGRTVIEALAMDVPVVATDAGGPPEIIRPGRDGDVLPPNDTRGWAEAVSRAIERGQGRGSRAYAVDRFGTDRHAASITAVYERVLRTARRR